MVVSHNICTYSILLYKSDGGTTQSIYWQHEYCIGDDKNEEIVKRAGKPALLNFFL